MHQLSLFKCIAKSLCFKPTRHTTVGSDSPPGCERDFDRRWTHFPQHVKAACAAELCVDRSRRSERRGRTLPRVQSGLNAAFLTQRGLAALTGPFGAVSSGERLAKVKLSGQLVLRTSLESCHKASRRVQRYGAEVRVSLICVVSICGSGHSTLSFGLK